MDSDEIRFNVIFKDGSIFHGSRKDKLAYIVTEYSEVKIKLSDIDTVEIGILPYYMKEDKIVRLLREIACNAPTDTAIKRRCYDKLISMKIGALPIIRKYIEDETLFGIKNDSADGNCMQCHYNAANVLKALIAKYKVSKNFMDKDIIYLHSGFKIGGIFTNKKRRALIKFGGFTFPREGVKRIIFFH